MKNKEEPTIRPGGLLLDSRLITRVRFQKYNYKIVRFGEYLQVYFYPNSKVKNNTSLEKMDINSLKKNIVSIKQDKHIEDRNIIRTKLNCQRLAKANAKDWESFITLTYAENMQNVEQSKKDLEYFVKNIKKVKKDFKYIAIPEFQERGAIHFHLLTNLSLQDNNIIVPQREKAHIKQKANEKYYDVKYWNKGYCEYENIKNDVKKIVGYISKYMTKENADDRLFNFKRYTSSQNLEKPITEFIDSQDKKACNYLKSILENKNLIYTNSYLDLNGNSVVFQEFLK